MKKIINTAASIICLFATGCASIVTLGGGGQTVRINSNPDGAMLSIFDREGKAVSTGTTPTSISLKRHSGFFAGEDYKLLFEAPGYYPSEMHVRAKMNGWYFGNILFGGVIGLVIVDPATGAMWTLSPKTVNRNLISAEVTLTPEELKEAEIKANTAPKKKSQTPK